MPADAARLRFFADESALGLGKVLALARRDVIHAGHQLIPEVPLGTLDPDWMPLVAQRGLIVIARDRRIRSKPAELSLFHHHKLRAFWIAGKRDLSTWETLTRVVRLWEEMEKAISDQGEGPWGMAINERSVTEVRLRLVDGRW